MKKLLLPLLLKTCLATEQDDNRHPYASAGTVPVSMDEAPTAASSAAQQVALESARRRVLSAQSRFDAAFTHLGLKSKALSQQKKSTGAAAADGDSPSKHTRTLTNIQQGYDSALADHTSAADALAEAQNALYALEHPEDVTKPAEKQLITAKAASADGSPPTSPSKPGGVTFTKNSTRLGRSIRDFQLKHPTSPMAQATAAVTDSSSKTPKPGIIGRTYCHHQ